jgi:hypothetical protein
MFFNPLKIEHVFYYSNFHKCFQKTYGSLEFENISIWCYKKIRHKAHVDIMFFNTLKIEHVFYYSNSHQMLSKK